MDKTARSVGERPGTSALKLLYQFAFLLVAFLVACYSGLPLERFAALVVLLAALGAMALLLRRELPSPAASRESGN